MLLVFGSIGKVWQGVKDYSTVDMPFIPFPLGLGPCVRQ